MTSKKDHAIILSPFFFPEPISTGKYNGLLAEGLVKAGVHVTAVCSYPIYPDWVPQANPADMPGVSSLRGGGSIKYPSKPILRRAVLEPWFAYHCVRQLKKIGKSASSVIAVFPPSLFMLLVPHLVRQNTKLIGIVHDLQGVYAGRKSGLFGRLLQRGITWVERRAFQACDHLIFLSETMRQVTIKEYGVDLKKTSVHYPFVTIPKQSDGDQAELNAHFDAGLKSIVYSGALGEKQAPEKLAKLFIAILDKHPDWQARIFSQGPIFDSLQATYQHPRLKYSPLVDARLLPALLARSDIQVVPQDVGTSDGSLPSKLPNIIAAGTKLLCITDPASELENLVNTYPAGKACTDWSLDACMNAFEELAQLSQPDLSQSEVLLRQFTLEGLVDRINNIHK